MVRRTRITLALGLPVLGLALFLLLPAAFSNHAAAAEDITVSARLSRAAATVDAPVLLRLTVHGARDAEVDIPEVDGLHFQRQGQSTQLQVRNGSFTSSVTFTYTVTALREGRYSIPPLTATVKGERYRTEPLSLEVGAAGRPGSSPPGATREQQRRGEADTAADAFITVEGMKKKGYVGEIMPVEIKAFFRQGLRAEITALPELGGDGFVMAPLTNKPEQTSEVHDGIAYSVLTWQGAISPIREGTSTLGLHLDATLYVPQRQETGPPRDPFFDDDFFHDDLFDRFFGRTSRVERTLQSPKVPVQVLPLPAKGRPKDFSGAVGTFDFAVSAAPDRVSVGEPVTLTMTVSGRGNFDRVSAPQFPAAPGWKTYSPSSATSRRDDGAAGKKTFEQAIVPQHSGLSEVPALQFSYFDPEEEAYVTLTAEPLPITVEEAPGGMAPQPRQPATTKQPAAMAEAEQAEAEQAPAPEVQVRLHTGSFVESITPLYRRGWFITLALVCTGLLAGLAGIGLARRRRARSTGEKLRKRVEQETAVRLAAAEQALGEGDDRRFLVECRALLQHRLAFSWQLTADAVTARDLRRRLGPDSPLAALMEQAEQQAYGGLHLDRNAMEHHLDTLKRELAALP